MFKRKKLQKELDEKEIDLLHKTVDLLYDYFANIFHQIHDIQLHKFDSFTDINLDKLLTPIEVNCGDVFTLIRVYQENRFASPALSVSLVDKWNIVIADYQVMRDTLNVMIRDYNEFINFTQKVENALSHIDNNDIDEKSLSDDFYNMGTGEFSKANTEFNTARKNVLITLEMMRVTINYDKKCFDIGIDILTRDQRTRMRDHKVWYKTPDSKLAEQEDKFLRKLRENKDL